ncbi:phosphoglucomutase [Thraustotheca clavata]|uniref:Phosphoglucomutase n=1 Tax=Thraustotheca clavata TaxID=74557 RepID=A0A1V9ZQB9_9STRA|nr:phosphoglucomutase [Thraustotheca clavata]
MRGSQKMDGDNATWIEAGQQWVEWDVNEGTKAEIQALLDAEDVDGLRQKLGKRLEFGTAGLRAAMGSGTVCMNDLVIIQTMQGLCKYLEGLYGTEDVQTRGIALGYDHRSHDTLNSEKFALYSAAVAVSRGIKVYLYKGFVATPLVPFCVDQMNCVAGIMVTASHNPKADNGYKVYGANGSQIIPPHDALISQSILENLAPWQEYDIENVRDHELCIDPTEELCTKYFEAVSELSRYTEENSEPEIHVKVAYTAMHGVGHAFTSRSFAAFNLPPYVPVEQQIQPDPEFPTVAFPNPEEGKGALQLSFETAESNDCTLVLANDPDADRLAVAELLPSGQWYVFTGNEIGTLLGHWEYTQYMRLNPEADKEQIYVIASTVSSKMLRAIARKEGFNFVETLTGFKWMGNATSELRNAGKTVLFSFEEAIGFCVGSVVKDKDGVCAAAVFAEMAQQLKKQGVTVHEHLQHLYATYGPYTTQNHYVKCYDPPTIQCIFARLRNEGRYWHTCGNYPIAGIRDLTTGFDSDQPDNKAILPVSSSSEMITYTFKNGVVATLRTSGTEPKLKYYCESPGQIGMDREDVQRELADQVACIVEEMLQPELNNLERS